MNSISRSKNVQPRTGETHRLFGVKYLKRHNMRDVNWTAEDLITQYERLSNIYRKANKVAALQKEQDELKTIGRYKWLKKEVKDKREILQSLLKGDVQRTKNVLQDHPKFQRMYQNKQSYEVHAELDLQKFLKQEKLNRYDGERARLVQLYEQTLMQVAEKQETIRYYDVKEFQQERDTKRLQEELKKSAMRSRRVQKFNSTYKLIINAMLYDSLYYLPLMEALNADWQEQTMLVKQTNEIGNPASENVKKLEVKLKNLKVLVKNEDSKHFKEIAKSRLSLKEHPKVVKKLVRRDSDFSMLGGHYDRDTRSMTNLKTQIGDVEPKIKMLKSATLSSKAEEIFSRFELQPELNDQMKRQLEQRQQVRDSIDEEHQIAGYVRELLLDDKPQIYNDEKSREIQLLESVVQVEKDKQEKHKKHMMKRAELSIQMRLAFQHILDVLRHVGSSEVFKNLEYPTVDLNLPLLDFNPNLPTLPMLIETDLSKLLASLKSRIQLLMQHYQKEKKFDDLNETQAKFQQAMIEDSMRTSRPHKPSLDFD